ncbi:DUF2256 domain-containing protein [Marivirga tractuosa]|uniref:DUF2256 domain-containing protein n=1 Tax=Marivirga tractuosa TaxID=1006 RepID=UPI0035D12DAB
MPKMLRKSELPSKICPMCNRPFTWRKKWKKDWETVKYCSQKCGRMAKKTIVRAKFWILNSFSLSYFYENS